ncbi:glycosyl hydrolase family 28-related protein [Luteococcus sp.]|uniref:right-handed parallel beta-helix repeat-containing protein n=1 Tax=Luteococcus sp. TaxID=1969402 RepID=UPI003735B0CB
MAVQTHVAHGSDEGRSAINVRALGAAGDGTKNDTRAIDQALRSYDIVYFPAGKYVHDGRLVLRPGQSLRGDGDATTILAAVQFATRCTADWLTIHATDCSVFDRVVDGAVLTGVHFMGGNHLAALSFDDNRVTNCTFNWCKFSHNTVGNGVKIVEKGFYESHYENLTFNGCQFFENRRMNFEAIQRNGNKPVTMGYSGIVLNNCQAIGNREVPNQINVSFDSEFLSDGSRRSSGFSTINGGEITGGEVALELAGSIHMTVDGTSINDASQKSIVVCQVSASEDAGHKILNVTTSGSGRVDIAGSNNLVKACNLSSTDKALRLVYASNTVVDGCTITTTYPTAMTIETSQQNEIKNCHFKGGSYNSILVLYPGTHDNSVHDCTFERTHIDIDVRDNNRLAAWSNN